MRAKRWAGISAAVVGSALLGSLLAASVSPSAAATTSDYQRAFRIGLEAYTYGLPLLTTNTTFLTMTSTNVSQGAFGPVNQFNNVRSPNNSGSTTVVAPGSTSLSSIAWLDLSTQPQVLHVPAVSGHFFVLAFLDPYTTNLVNLGTAMNTTPGDYVVCAPGQCSAPLPNGTHRIDVDYTRIWIIGSTQLLGESDIPVVNAIQDQYTLTPLDAFIAGTDSSITPPPVAQPTITPVAMPTGLAFFDTLGQLLTQFPPPPRDAKALRTFASVGIGPGLSPSQNPHLSAATLQGLTAAVAAGPARIQRDTKVLYAADFPRHNGYLLGGFGAYGTDYVKRAVISQIGLGAFTADQAIYAMAWNDAKKAPLNGSQRYVVHLQSPPPTNEGWSLTVYNLQGGLMSNPLNRFAFTNISPLNRNADGSIDIYLQPNAPKNATRQSNWLPVTAGQGFEVTWRLFAPKGPKVKGILSGTGWQPPSITPAS